MIEAGGGGVMVDLSKLTIWIATSGKKWVAATACAPYFCFEAESEEAALELASAALHFYVAASSKIETKDRGRES
jgi:predicted RNase H-like HicB family nuclease